MVAQTNADRNRFHLELVRQFVGSSDKILDAGCGYGRILVPLAHEKLNVIGIDRSARLLATCKAALTDAQLVQGDLFKLPFRENEFDKVICFWGVTNEMTENELIYFFSELRRTLKDGGEVLIEAPDVNSDGFLSRCRKENWDVGEAIHMKFDQAELFYSFNGEEEILHAAEISDFSKCLVWRENISEWSYPRICAKLHK